MKPYPAYKPSDVPWLEKLPEHWGVIPIRYLSRGVKTGGTPSQEAFTDFPTENDIPWYTPADLDKAYLTTGSRVVSLDSVGEVHVFEPGTIAMVGIGDVGRVSILTTRATGNQQLNFICPVESVLATFLTYTLLAAQGFVQSRANVTIIPILNQENTKRLRMPAPPFEEQQAIAAYLGRETARINTLIDEKGRLIETLREYRQATISEIATQGLDPAAPKKPSGVPWLGELPAHWTEAQVRHITHRVTDGAHVSPDTTSPDVPFVSTVDIKADKIDFENCLRTTSDSYALMRQTGCKPYLGDVLFSKDGTIGRTCVVTFEREFAVASSLVIVSPESERVNSQYLSYWFNNNLLKQYIELLLAGAALRRISVEKVGRLPVILPPLGEQQAIAIYLDTETDKIDKLITHVQDEIKLLQELRAATITDAVLGRIDLSGLVAPAGEN
jgi:type I restriction enzyme S subunit